MPFSFSMPRRLFTGEGALTASLPTLGTLGRRAFIVTDATMVKLGMVERVTGELASAGISCESSTAFPASPPIRWSLPAYVPLPVRAATF